MNGMYMQLCMQFTPDASYWATADLIRGPSSGCSDRTFPASCKVSKPEQWCSFVQQYSAVHAHGLLPCLEQSTKCSVKHCSLNQKADYTVHLKLGRELHSVVHVCKGRQAQATATDTSEGSQSQLGIAPNGLNRLSDRAVQHDADLQANCNTRLILKWLFQMSN